MLRRVIHFLRPTFWALILFGLAVGIADLAPRGDDTAPELVGAGGFSTADLAKLDLSSVVLPRPALSPEEVVKLQLAGLGDQKPDGVGILQCFCFASPGNREVTGPLENFGRIVRQGPYRCMASPRAVLIGRPQVDGRVARLLVTVIDEASQVRAFTFVLARQRQAPLEDCWMTEAVLPALPTPDVEDPAAPPTA